MKHLPLALVATLVLAGCGSSEPAPATTANPAASAPANPLEAAQQAAQQVQSGEPVKFESLQALMPTVAGWEKGELTGMGLSVPFKAAQASLTLKKGEAEIAIEMVDTVFNQMMYAPVAAYLSAGFSSSDSNGYKKSTTINGQPAFEEWDKNERSGNVTVLVAKRFLVHVRGTGVDNTDDVKAVANQIDMARLAALK